MHLTNHLFGLIDFLSNDNMSRGLVFVCKSLLINNNRAHTEAGMATKREKERG